MLLQSVKKSARCVACREWMDAGEPCVHPRSYHAAYAVEHPHCYEEAALRYRAAIDEWKRAKKGLA